MEMIDITQSNTNVKQLGTIHFNGKRDGEDISFLYMLLEWEGWWLYLCLFGDGYIYVCLVN